MLTLGIETSCDETSAGIVDEEGRVHANVVATQVDVHARYGGIVPEVASRQHVLDIRTVVQSALEKAGTDWDGIDVIAVTYGPGLAGSLIVGVNMAKGISANTGIPLVGVNHLDGHIYAAWARLADAGSADRDMLNGVLESGKGVMCLLVSGGHTELVLMRGDNDFELIGETRDDAAGEAFDKAARVLGLRYPGGPEIQRIADTVESLQVEPLSRAWMKGTNDFSFSGIKTAVLNRARSEGIYPVPGGGVPAGKVAALARAFQDSVVDVLVTKTLAAAEEYGCGAIVVAGGVAANRPLREAFRSQSPLPVVIPPISLCTDNGAMIAMSGMRRYLAGRRDGWGLDVEPGLRIGSTEPGR
ncbi:MAG: tRNA (adenosine(37)-N6)-threonylcarbamoyltransferase complex transferase subunit TsaD [Chloroflexi bacterium]|nr:tRNA (adenosine(37)-N6)-threonylcarbamoyltransferase complex transferase subunit TsaD [Chloroflexota bacterium]